MLMKPLAHTLVIRYTLSIKARKDVLEVVVQKHTQTASVSSANDLVLPHLICIQLNNEHMT